MQAAIQRDRLHRPGPESPLSREARPTRGLAREYFTDEALYRRETERVFAARWSYLGRAEQLAEPGDYLVHAEEGERVVVVRDGEDKVHAFHDHCRHRGTRLCEAERGHIERALVCPYHGWSYGLDGALLGAPNMADTPGFRREEHGLHPVAVGVWEGGLFLNLDGRAEPLEEYFAPLTRHFAPWAIGELRVAHSISYEVRANWKLIAQNYSECYHCPRIHPELNVLSGYRETFNDLESGPFLGGPMEIAAPGGGLTSTGERCAPDLPGLEGDDLQRSYYYCLFPDLLLSLQPDFVMAHRLIRRAPDRTLVSCQMLFRPEAMAEPGFDAGPCVEMWDQVNREDWAICERSQEGISSRAYTPGPYSTMEPMLPALDREYLAAMGAD